LNDKEAELFLTEIRRVSNDNIIDLEDAISYALATAPKVKYDTWFGTIGNGTYYADSRESRWFNNLSPREAAQVLVEEMM
jgi:hypothetical protein